MMVEAEKRQRSDRRRNLFRRKNKSFPKQFEGDLETPEAEEMLEFWKRNNKEASKERKEDMYIGEVLNRMRRRIQREKTCRWFAFTEEELDEVLWCTTPWKACGVDSAYSFPIKKYPLIRKAVYELVKEMVEWKLTDHWDEENSWLLEGRTC